MAGFDSLRYCEKCADTGGMIVTTNANGDRVAGPCPCRAIKLPLLRWDAAMADCEGLKHCSFENLDTSKDQSLYLAKVIAIKFCTHWPYGLEGKGIIFTGNNGRGKTHLAVAMLRDLMFNHGVKRGKYLNERRLFQAIRESYEDDATVREAEILNPVVEGLEVLVLDELGTGNMSEWKKDKIADILDTRINKALTTFITTNFPMEESGHGSLGERIGSLCYSRICQMCVHIQVNGTDYRQNAGRATVQSLDL